MTDPKTNGTQQNAAQQPTRSLEQLQRWMQTVIAHPEGIINGINDQAARAQIDLSNDGIESVITRSKNLTSTERLDIYANAYFARLLECLAEEFPAMTHMIGEELFANFAIGYLQEYPSTSYTLGDLSRNFPRYLKENRPPHNDDEPIDWLDFLIELAELQRIYTEIFDGPGQENQPLLQTDDLLAIPPDHWGTVRFTTVPCLQLHTFQFPVHHYTSSVRLEEEPEHPVPTPTYLAISRIDFRVRRWDLSETQYRLLSALIAGDTLSTAISKAISQETLDHETEMETITTNLRDWFEEWSTCGFFIGVTTTPVES